MYYRTPGFPILPYLPEFAQIHVIESVMLSNHLIFCHPLLLLPWIFSSIIVFSDWAFHIRWPKYWSFSFNISPCNEYSGLTSFRIDWFWSPGSPRNSQESSSVSQFKSINSSVLSLPYGPTLTSIHDYWSNHSFDHVNLREDSFPKLKNGPGAVVEPGN